MNPIGPATLPCQQGRAKRLFLHRSIRKEQHRKPPERQRSASHSRKVPRVFHVNSADSAHPQDHYVMNTAKHGCFWAALLYWLSMTAAVSVKRLIIHS